MWNRKIIGILIWCAAVATHATAQGLSIGLNGGLQGMQYTLQNGATKRLPGGSLELLYTFRLKDPLELLTGISGGVYRTQATLPNGAVFSDYQVDDAGSAFQYNVKTEGYKETQRFFAVSIPVLLQYHLTGAGAQWYFNGGVKLLFPSSCHVNISAQQLGLSGYYPDYNVVLSNVPQHGFGTYNGWQASTSAALKPSAALSAGAGLVFRLPGGMHIYTGLYVDYGLTDLKGKSDSLPLVGYSSSGASGVKANSVLNMTNAGPAKAMAVGLQVRLYIGKIRSKPVARLKPKEVPAAAPAPATSAPVPTTTPPSATPAPTTTSVPATMAPVSPIISDISDEEAAFIQKPIVFGTMDETAVPGSARTQLDAVASIMLQHPTLRLSIVGHICNSGMETEDPKVGVARAKAVARYLMGKGIRKERMEISGEKESDAVTPNNPGANFQKRRVVMSVK